MESDKKVEISTLVKFVSEDLMEVWRKASIPTQSFRNIERKVTAMYDEAKKCERFGKDYPEKELLFDICGCQCPQVSCNQFDCKDENCGQIHILHRKGFPAKCNVRVDEKELPFLIDQRNERKMMIGGLHIQGSKDLRLKEEKIQRVKERKEKEKEREEKERKRKRDSEVEQAEANAGFFAENEGEESTFMEKKEAEAEYEPERKKSRNTSSFESLALACDGAGISSRKAALIANSYGKDIGYLTNENKETHTLGKSKLDHWRRMRRKKQREKEEKEISSRPVTAVYFDGKKTATLTSRPGRSGKPFQKTELQDHYVMIEEPQSVYLGHVIPCSGHGISLAVAMHRHLSARGWTKDAWVAGCDGCNGNVGNEHGCLAYLERLLGHPVEWNICLLHGNELPLRALFKHHVGKTTGPNSFSGPLGEELKGELNKLKVVRFARIKNDDFPVLPEEVVADLGHDQEYLYDSSWGIIEGYFDDDLADRETGLFYIARWVTLMNRINRCYASKRNPCKALKRLTHIGILYYTPSWFTIKCNPDSKDGPKNLMKMIEFSRKLEPEEQTIVQRTMQRNGFYAHPENVLRSMLMDEDVSIRDKAVRKILEIRRGDLVDEEGEMEEAITDEEEKLEEDEIDEILRELEEEDEEAEEEDEEEVEAAEERKVVDGEEEEEEEDEAAGEEVEEGGKEEVEKGGKEGGEQEDLGKDLQGKKKVKRKAAFRSMGKKQGKKKKRRKKSKKSKKEKRDPLTLLSLSFEEEMAIKSTSI